MAAASCRRINSHTSGKRRRRRGKRCSGGRNQTKAEQRDIVKKRENNFQTKETNSRQIGDHYREQTGAAAQPDVFWMFTIVEV